MTNSHGASQPLMLAIESSCDETAAAVIARDLTVLSSVVASQAQLHERFGGVVPEIASRAHVERILPVIDEALKRAGVTLQELTAIAVVTEPGLVGSLLVGLTAAKTLAWTLGIPLVAVNHVEGHIYACRLAAGRDLYPAVGLVVSGGHTNLYDCRGATDCRLIGSTIDDAAGEAFDKVASILGLPYPGGPSIEARASAGNPRAFAFPRSFLKDARLDFSFSGLKTAVLYEAQGTPGGQRSGAVNGKRDRKSNVQQAPPPLTEQRVADLAASFQEAVVDVLIAKCQQTLDLLGYRVLCVGGGVAANSRLRDRLDELSKSIGVEVHLSPKEYCTDNAAMAAIGWELLDAGRTAELDCDVTPGLVRMP